MKRRRAKKRSRQKILDEFTDLPVSRQRKNQLRRQRDGLCMICGQPRFGAYYCLKHLLLTRERQRIRNGTVKRNLGAKSYQLEALAVKALKRPRKSSAPTKDLRKLRDFTGKKSAVAARDKSVGKS